MTKLAELVRKNRSYRKFVEERRIDRSRLVQFIENARVSGSARNAQPLRFIIINEEDECAELFKTLTWAGFLKDWDGPERGERPAAYIVILKEKNSGMEARWDEGITCQTITLSAVEAGLGACVLAAVNRTKAREILSVSDDYDIELVIALGEPAETVVIDDTETGESLHYWRDEDNVHHVPKRKIEEIIIR